LFVIVQIFISAFPHPRATKNFDSALPSQNNDPTTAHT
jgi:hypothetical protein